MAGWQTIKLSDVVRTNVSTYSLSDNWEFVNYLDTGNIVTNEIALIQRIELAQGEKLPSRARRKVEIGDIIYSTVRPNQLHYGFIDNIPENFLVSTGFAVLHPEKGKIDAKFLYYLLVQNDITEKLQAIAEQSTSTYPSIKPSDIEDLDFIVPEIKVQRKISNILSAIDKKIELNAQINHNLEEQAALIFADWLQGCNESVAIGDLSTNILDYTPINNGFVRLLNSSDVTEGVFPDIQLVPNANLKGHFKKRFQLGDILYSEIRPRNHHYGFVLFDASEYIASTRLMVIRALDYKVSPAMLYQYLLLPNVEAEFTLKTESRSGTFPQGNYADIASIKIPYAPVKAQNEVSSTLTKVRQTIANNHLENRQLSELRDALLPKLMSGEIDVSEVEV